MPNPTPSDVHVNQPLTNISIAYIQNAAHFVAARVFPNIPVAKQSDRYYIYDRGAFNRDEMKKRAPATESAGGSYTVDNTPTYFADVRAFHHDVPDQRRANSDSPLMPDREATIICTQKALIKREKIFSTNYFAPGVWTFGLTGVASNATPGTEFLQWNDPNSTPIEDIRAAITSVLEETGFEPNTLTLGKRTFDALIDHPDIVDRVKYGQTAPGVAIIDAPELAALFKIPNVYIMKAIENTRAEGLTPLHTFIGGKHALLSYRPDEPALMTPSAGYTFSWTGYLGASAEGTRMTRFRMEHLKADRVEIEAAFDLKRVSPDLGFFFGSAVA